MRANRHRWLAVVRGMTGVAACGGLLAMAVGCGDRAAFWDQYAAAAAPVAATTSNVAVVDESSHRLVLLSSDAQRDLRVTSVALGKRAGTPQVSPDGSRLFVLSQGDAPVTKPNDQSPSLTVVRDPGGGGTPTAFTRSLDVPFSGLAIDSHADGRWLVLYPQPGLDSAFVENPNLILLIDVNAPDKEPVPLTLRSTGGYPQRFTFSDPLTMPDGSKRHLLVIESDRDVALLDLDHVDGGPRDPVSVELQLPHDATFIAPAAVTLDAGDGTPNDTGRIGVRLSNSNNVLALRIVPPNSATPINDFTVQANLTDVGGQVSDMRFVQTNHGTRLAALVPRSASGGSKAVLVDTDMSLTVDVPLTVAYDKLSVVTGNVGVSTPGDDVAMLWQSGTSSGYGTSSVAFWTTADEAAFRSTANVQLQGYVTGVVDVGHDHPELKVLETSGTSPFYVLNLGTQMASPIIRGNGSNGRTQFEVSGDGQRLWAFDPGATAIGVVGLDGNLATRSVPVQRPFTNLFDVANGDGSRSLVLLHPVGGIGATVLDGKNPQIANARLYAAVLLGGRDTP